jgi:hypothetical protein
MKTALNTLILAAAMLVVGCKASKDEKPPMMSTFVPEGEVRRSEQFARMQAATGALEDGILYPWHFDGQQLSPLGREKLDLIADADTDAPISVYLDVKSNTFADRSKSVTAYLQDKGMAVAHVKVLEGINEATLNPAADNLAYRSKTDSKAEGGGKTTSTGGAANSGSGGGSLFGDAK